MEVKFLTFFHPLTKELAQSTDKSAQVSLALVVGSANNLYKLQDKQTQEGGGSVNLVIIDTWLEKIEPVKEKLDNLFSQIEHKQAKPLEQASYLRFELLAENKIAQDLLYIIERLDRVLTILATYAGGNFSAEKYQQIQDFFRDAYRDLMDFPYKQNANLNKKLLNLHDRL